MRTSRKPLLISGLAIGVAGVVALAATAFSGGDSSADKSARTAATGTGTSTSTTGTSTTGTPSGSAPDGAASGSTSPAAPPSATDSTPAQGATPGGPDSTGAYASDGVTPLSQFPSLARVDDALPAGERTVTTIDARYQRAAATAVSSHPDSGMVVLRPSTGAILAMASQGLPYLAYSAERAPGSTFKVITAADLLRNGLTESSPAPCVAVDKNGIHNDTPDLVNAKATLAWAFAHSCNTSFTGQLGVLSDSPLSKEASTYFGLNQKWDLGLGPQTYGTETDAQVPPATDGTFAREMIGQGGITVSPLIMASVAATVEAGTFHQPYLVPGTKPTATARALDSGVARQLRDMMRQTVTDGTAASLRGVPGVAAKTGTAETGTANNDSWMIAYQPSSDVAVACLVEGGGHGDDEAGPEIAAMFGALK
ncbi:hypothetical protein GCM10009839_12310 [Catenulispora yoronensis]|uniref:Penicillin-binding protein transpeptidase domain-containing protein n=1 Tax=Catenulispora yoronensis TaxID=450799 RepID=A0ABN2TRD5_9ACTN